MKEKIKDIQTQIGTTPDGIWGEKSTRALRTYLVTGNKIAITKNITLNELLASQTATRYNINNMPTAQILTNLIESAVNLWQPARDILGHPIIITSGYRCPALNRKIGGAGNSAHLYGYAIDFSCPSFGRTAQVVTYLVKEFRGRGIKFDQCILEYPKRPNSWVHLGYKKSDGSQRNHTFTIG